MSKNDMGGEIVGPEQDRGMTMQRTDIERAAPEPDTIEATVTGVQRGGPRVFATDEPEFDAVERAADSIARYIRAQPDDETMDGLNQYDFLEMARAALAAAGDAPTLDELLDQLAPRAWLNVQTGDGESVAVIQMPGELGRKQRYVTGAGATRREAVLNAVAKAKGQSDE